MCLLYSRVSSHALSKLMTRDRTQLGLAWATQVAFSALRWVRTVRLEAGAGAPIAFYRSLLIYHLAEFDFLERFLNPMAAFSRATASSTSTQALPESLRFRNRPPFCLIPSTTIVAIAVLFLRFIEAASCRGLCSLTRSSIFMLPGNCWKGYPRPSKTSFARGCSIRPEGWLGIPSSLQFKWASADATAAVAVGAFAAVDAVSGPVDASDLAVCAGASICASIARPSNESRWPS
mmetsp:Transcript_17887/g.49604  ORF Transcript_17887/g.49604 Transcript_17887/m.49604 type:complete len:234 (+) Transcript_17887:146-847(+)